MALLELQLLIFDAHRGAGGNGVGDEGVGADDGVPADHRLAAQHRGAGIDGHIVLNCGMAFHAPQALTASGGQAAQGHALIDFHVLADDGGLADDDAGAMVDEEILPDGGAGMDVDAGDAVGVLRHDAGQQGHLQGVQNVRQAVDRNGKKAGIAEDDLVLAGGGGIAVKGGLHIGLNHGAQAGNPAESPPRRKSLCFLRSGRGKSFPFEPRLCQGNSFSFSD